ncbi:MAG: hypothetical protein K0R92_64 [Lachnospiraceae bacterium]|jgi:flagellar hook-basal body complex protein FliE|nr:hypothetical protein [Lachnospiraceae bacterium]
MDITALNSIPSLSTYNKSTTAIDSENRNKTFEQLFQSAVNMVNETNDLSNAAEQAEISYALGLSDSTHDLMVAQEKANLSLQYTVTVRNKVLEAYKEIMNLQF